VRVALIFASQCICAWQSEMAMAIHTAEGSSAACNAVHINFPVLLVLRRGLPLSPAKFLVPFRYSLFHFSGVPMFQPVRSFAFNSMSLEII
jgi:hypothetical protein